MSAPSKPLVLCILDGWGHREERVGNAVALASTPVFDRLWSESPRAFLRASGEMVGLPKNQVGNSEVGHMNMGAGRVALQELLRLDEALGVKPGGVKPGGVKPGATGGKSLRLPPLEKFIKTLKSSGGRCHLFGLLSPGGVHSHQEHIFRLMELVVAAGVPILLHTVSDGRDSPPFKTPQYWGECKSRIGHSDKIQAATLMGRYYAMDRDRRFGRVEKAWRAMALGRGKQARNIDEALEESYHLSVSDEFVVPTVIGDYSGVSEGDGLLVANFRTDRVRELLDALLAPDFRDFRRPAHSRFAACLGMRPYSIRLNPYMDSLLEDSPVAACLGEVLETAKATQMRIAETEKYAHVTFFMNGGREEPFDGEERLLIPSPRVGHYDGCPAMSSAQVAEGAVAAVKSGKYRVVIVNFANPDMVGHTGNLPATIKAVEATDRALGHLTAEDGQFIITADHGNAEKMIDKDGKPYTAHTCSPVPIMLVGNDKKLALKNGKLADLAPTMLKLLGLEAPQQMSGEPLFTGPNVIKMKHARSS